jgi:hypothetical protein
MKLSILAAVALLITFPTTAQARCYSWQTSCEIAKPAPGEKWKITDDRRQRLGDIYNPGHNRRLQIRDNHRRIIGYIEENGALTDTRRKKVGAVEELMR